MHFHFVKLFEINLQMVCIICGGNHHTRQCNYPLSVSRCACSRMVFGPEDNRECVNNELKSYRLNVCAATTKSFFKMRVLDTTNFDGAEVFFFNKTDGRFEAFNNSLDLLNSATSGIFTIGNNENYFTVDYQSTKLVNFNFFITLIEYHGASVVVLCQFQNSLTSSNLSDFEKEEKR